MLLFALPELVLVDWAFPVLPHLMDLLAMRRQSVVRLFEELVCRVVILVRGFGVAIRKMLIRWGLFRRKDGSIENSVELLSEVVVHLLLYHVHVFASKHLLKPVVRLLSRSRLRIIT